MCLEEYITRSPLWRPITFPFFSRSVAIVCFDSDLAFIPNIIGDKIFEICHRIFVINPNRNLPHEMAKDGKTIPVDNIGNINKYLNYDIVLFSHTFDYVKFVDGSELIHRKGFLYFFVYMPLPYNAGITTTHLPDYYDRNKENLEQVFDMLEDEESKKVFAARIRSLLTGNIGYLRLSNYPEYFHPAVKPQTGDVILDGGISGYIDSQLKLCKAIGETGRLYGFEPDPIGFMAAYDLISARDDCSNFQLIPLGLWNKKTKVAFNSAGVGSHVSTGKEGVTIECTMTTIDDFAKDYKLKKVDFIKLDVEGSEFQAIRASIKTVTRFKPKLAISIYHLQDDLYELPLLIKKIIPESKFYLGHHHASLHETVLYVLPNHAI